MREKWAVVVTVALVFVGLLMYLVVYSVRVDQIAVHRRLGKVIRIVRPELGLGAGPSARSPLLTREHEGVQVVDRAGWFFKLPWPFDKVAVYDQRIRVVDGPLAQTQLPDGNQVIPRAYATWRIADPVSFEESLKGDEETARQSLKQIISDQTAEVLGKYSLDDVVNTDPSKLKFDQIEQEILAGVRDRLAKSQDAYGLEVLTFGITWLALPKDTTAAVFSRMEWERRRLAQDLRAKGESIKQTLIAQANAQKEKILAEAEAQAKDIRSEAEAEAAKYYDVFAKDQDLAIYLRGLEALKKIAQDASANERPLTIMLSTKTAPFGILERGPLKAPETLEVKAPKPPVPHVIDPNDKGATAAPASASGEK